MGMDWESSTSYGPWRNGCSESLIKYIKKTNTCAIGEQVLSFSELQTALFKAVNLVDERPIGRHTTSLDEGSY